MSVCDGHGFVQKQEAISVQENESPSSLMTDCPIALRGFMEFDSRYIADEWADDNSQQMDDREMDADDPDAGSPDIVGSYQHSPLMDFIAWDLLV
jgi:hypothetical protein